MTGTTDVTLELCSEALSPGASPTAGGPDGLAAGMYVRVPMDLEEGARGGDYRDLCLGLIEEINPAAGTARVLRLIPDTPQRMRCERLERDLGRLKRCAVAPGASFIRRETRQRGRVLIEREPGFVPGRFKEYYVHVGDRVLLLPESQFYAAFNDMDVDPVDQLLAYEFHPPMWKGPRDRVIESLAALQSATYGIEDLVGTRVFLLAHQAEVIARVLGDRTCRYMLADEVGLGKTIEACVILKGLRRRYPMLRALLIVPAALLRQWRHELDAKFWLNFPILASGPFPAPTDPLMAGPGFITSHEAVDSNPELRRFLSERSWDLLIVDEAHNLRRKPKLYEQVHALSERIERVLILSATPVERRAGEYLALLKLMYPGQYDRLDEGAFGRMLEAQGEIRRAIAFLAKALNPEEFDTAEFQEGMAPVLEQLSHDVTLGALFAGVREDEPDRGLAAARETLQYVSENYRIESRVIRNRRASLAENEQIDLAERKVDLSYAYTPGGYEAETLLALHEYADACLREHGREEAALDTCVSLFHAAFGSPHALLALLAARARVLQSRVAPAAARGMTEFRGESALLERVTWQANRWAGELNAALARLPQRAVAPEASHRLVQVLRLVQAATRTPGAKLLVFSAWPATLEVLYDWLRGAYGRSAIAQFRRDMASDVLQAEVDRFQADDACRVLLSDESGGEGRNFQMADQIVHVDLPWTPAQVEQRIGRVDRLGRSGVVVSVVPYAKGTVEEDLFNLWHSAFRLFEQSMSGLEIVLEEVQDKIAAALAHSTERGVAEMLPGMLKSATRLRAEVEEERYFEEGAVDYRRRAEFAEISEAYRDGERLRGSLMSWSNMAGMNPSGDRQTGIVTFNPRHFNFKSLENAKFALPPSMVEALKHSGNTHNLVIRGTFDRDRALKREDIVFFAPGEPWTDALLANAQQADRGRCTAILRPAPELPADWLGLELFYRVLIDPRPLYAEGHHPSQLFRAQGYLEFPTRRLLVGADARVVRRTDPVNRLLTQPYDDANDRRIGRRSGARSLLPWFKETYPAPGWPELVHGMIAAATAQLDRELASMPAAAAEAEAAFAQSAAGQRAALRWHAGQETPERLAEIEAYEQTSAALVRGIAHPVYVLESACVWLLQAGGAHGG